VVRYTLAAVTKIMLIVVYVLMTPLAVISFIGCVAEEVEAWLKEVLPWMHKETKEGRRRRLL